MCKVDRIDLFILYFPRLFLQDKLYYLLVSKSYRSRNLKQSCSTIRVSINNMNDMYVCLKWLAIYKLGIKKSISCILFLSYKIKTSFVSHEGPKSRGNEMDINIMIYILLFVEIFFLIRSYT